MKSVLLVMLAAISAVAKVDIFSEPELASLEIVTDEDACWLQAFRRGGGKPTRECPPGTEKSGALCYPPCEEGYNGVGPVCWKKMKPKGRGWGRIPKCVNNTVYHMGMCFHNCPSGYQQKGPLCAETCPEHKPYKCGMLCTKDFAQCHRERMELSMGGFGMVYGIAAVTISSLAVIGTSGLAIALGTLGIIGGTVGLTTSSIELAQQLISYPMCYRHNGSFFDKLLSKSRKKYDGMVDRACRRINDTITKYPELMNSSLPLNDTSVGFEETVEDQTPIEPQV